MLRASTLVSDWLPDSEEVLLFSDWSLELFAFGLYSVIITVMLFTVTSLVWAELRSTFFSLGLNKTNITTKYITYYVVSLGPKARPIQEYIFSGFPNTINRQFHMSVWNINNSILKINFAVVNCWHYVIIINRTPTKS